MTVSFRGPIQSGRKTGLAEQPLGTVILHQSVTITSTTSGRSSILLPADSKIVNMTVDVRVSASANTAGIQVRVGSTADVTQFATIRTSAPARYMPGVAPNVAAASATSWNNVGTADIHLFIDVTAVTSAGQVD